MVFPETVVFNFVLLRLEEEIASYVAPAPDPLPCDRWIARSCLQKAIRRGEVQIAQRALATLLEKDRYGIWRHLIIIALEDVGVPGMDLIAQVAAAGRDRPWRKCQGGEWAVASFFAQRMAESVHCQAVCDLLLRATNCSVFDKARADALDAEAMDLMAQLVDDDRGLVGRALTALALGGGLAEGQRHHETAGVLDALAGKGFSSEVLATSHAAWRISRNPMALLLPLVWQRWATTDKHDVRDDEIAPAVMLGCVPDYAIDQFTRVGGQVARGYLKICAEMDNLLEAAGIAQAQRPRALGDLIFLAEGGCITRRAIWDIGERLRRPNRALPYAVRLADLIQPSLDLLDATRPVIENLRQHHFHTQIIG